MKIYWWFFLPCWRQSCWRIIFVWLSILISTFMTLGICMEMWLAFPQKFSFCCFLLFLLELDSFVCSITMTFTATNSILPETAFWQEAKGRSRRSRGGLKVQRSYFHESALCNGKMKRQKCCRVFFFSLAMIHATYLQLLYHFSFLWDAPKSFNPFVALLQEGAVGLTLWLMKTLPVSGGKQLPNDAPKTWLSVCWKSVLVQNIFQQVQILW